MDLSAGAVIAGVLTAASFAGALRSAFLANRDLEKSHDETLEDRLHRLGSTMTEASKLLAQVEAELSARAATAKRLKREAEQAEAAAALNQKEREAVAEMLRTEIVTEGRRSFRASLLANLLFFIAGAAVSVLVALLIT